jgi:hypothetical protein
VLETADNPGGRIVLTTAIRAGSFFLGNYKHYVLISRRARMYEELQYIYIVHSVVLKIT